MRPNQVRSTADEAASVLLSLPWELVHDGVDYLFQGAEAVGVRRRLPNLLDLDVSLTSLPIRILLVSPRPEDETAGYIDHRISARPLIDAVKSIGELVDVTVLAPPTVPALRQALRLARDAGEPFDVVHFDGHGVYNRTNGLGYLCFEDPNEADNLYKRSSVLVDATELSSIVRGYRIPVVFLEACQSAATDDDPTASVAATLLQGGVTSVVAMSHSVLVETARRFVKAFYEELARGSRVGTAMLEGRNALKDNDFRAEVMGAGELRLQDWFVPVLYQEENDPQLLTRLPSSEVERLEARTRSLSLGDLPQPPAHSFVGRSRDLLALERMLHQKSYAVVLGQGGAGKTTVAVELARWLVRTGRHQRAAFVSLEDHSEARSVLDSLGRQLLPGGWSVAQFPDLDEAMQHVERALSDRSTIIVLDNMESILPEHGRAVDPAAQEAVNELLSMCQRLERPVNGTRLLFTSRDALPAPYDNRSNTVGLGALSKEEAVELVSGVLRAAGLSPSSDDPGLSEDDIEELVETVGRHARGLVLLAPGVARSGVRATTAELQGLMAELHKAHPGDRENSLYASVELSLRRMSGEDRELVRGLGVFHGGGHIANIAHVLEVEPERAGSLAAELIGVGLGEYMGHNHLRLDPALPAYLLREMDGGTEERLRGRWAVGIQQLTSFLDQQQFEDVDVARRLTELELPDMMALLEWMEGRAESDVVAIQAGQVEQLVSALGLPRVVAQATRAREQAQEMLVQSSGGSTHARFATAFLASDKLIQNVELPAALEAARQLLQTSMDAGECAYQGAAYDIATSQLWVGRVLRHMNSSEEALAHLERAKQRFEALPGAGAARARHMVALAADESGQCQTQLGKLESAARAYQDAIDLSVGTGDRRQEAVSRSNLGVVLARQQRYVEALEACTQGRNVFESLGEPANVAIGWYQIGEVHRAARQHEQAEESFREALRIDVQLGQRGSEAKTLSMLGVLYREMSRHEDAVRFHRQAADVSVALKDLALEGMTRNNLAVALTDLKHYREARREITRAIECGKAFGDATQPWNSWSTLSNIERADGNDREATQARRNAIRTYRDYRLAGGVSQSPRAQTYQAVARAVSQGATAEVVGELTRVERDDSLPAESRLAASKLLAVLDGERDPALAEDPELDYTDAAELQLLLETLESEKA